MLKKISIPLLVATTLSLVTSYYVYQWLTSYMIDASIKNFNVSWWQIVKLFLTWLIYFSALIVLPFLWKNIIDRRKLKADSFWKMIAWMEFCSLLFAVLTTPPDLLSTIMVFFMCQPLVVLNAVVLFRNFKRALL